MRQKMIGLEKERDNFVESWPFLGFIDPKPKIKVFSFSFFLFFFLFLFLFCPRVSWFGKKTGERKTTQLCERNEIEECIRTERRRRRPSID